MTKLTYEEKVQAFVKERAIDLLCRARDSQSQHRVENAIEKSRLLFGEDDLLEHDNLVEEVMVKGMHEKVRRYPIDSASFNLLANKYGTYMAGGSRVLNEAAHRFLKEHELELKAIVFWGCEDYATETVFLGQPPCSKKIEQLLSMS